MKLKMLFLLIVALAFASCLSGPKNPASKQFADETGVNLTFAARGLVSLAHPDHASWNIYKKYTGGNITLIHDPAREHFAEYSQNGEELIIIFNNDIKNYFENERNVLVVAALYAASLYDGGFTDYRAVKRDFFKALTAYVASGYHMPNILKSDWFLERGCEVSAHSISIQ